MGNNKYKININDLTELREQTGASVIAIKKYLEETMGDKIKTLEILREQSFKIAEKKESKETKTGIIDVYLHPNRKIGVLIEVHTETDFVARNENFQKFVHNIAMQVAASNPADNSTLLEQSFIKDQNLKIGDILKEAISKFGEKIEIKRFIRYEI